MPSVCAGPCCKSKTRLQRRKAQSQYGVRTPKIYTTTEFGFGNMGNGWCVPFLDAYASCCKIQQFVDTPIEGASRPSGWYVEGIIFYSGLHSVPKGTHQPFVYLFYNQTRWWCISLGSTWWYVFQVLPPQKWHCAAAASRSWIRQPLLEQAGLLEMG